MQPRIVAPQQSVKHLIGRPPKPGTGGYRKVRKELTPADKSCVDICPVYLKITCTGRGSHAMSVSKVIPFDWQLVEVESHRTGDNIVTLTVRKLK